MNKKSEQQNVLSYLDKFTQDDDSPDQRPFSLTGLNQPPLEIPKFPAPKSEQKNKFD